MLLSFPAPPPGGEGGQGGTAEHQSKPHRNQNQFDPDAGAFINVTGIGGIEAQAINNLVNQYSLYFRPLWPFFCVMYFAIQIIYKIDKIY